MQKIKPKKPQFQIRKLPIKRFLPEKTPQLNALDVHSICLPTRNKKIINWPSLNCDQDEIQLQDLQQMVQFSSPYQQLIMKRSKMMQQHQSQKNKLQGQINGMTQQCQKQQSSKTRLVELRTTLYSELDTLRDQLAEQRDSNYNLRWQVYQQRGAHYANINGYSILQNSEMTYEQLLQMEEQMGHVPKGLSIEEIGRLPVTKYKWDSIVHQSKEICCICYEEVQQMDNIYRLKCKHVHHCDCLKDWLIKQKNCPICKQDIV